MKIMAKNKRYYISQQEKNLIKLMLKNNTRSVSTPRESAEIVNFDSETDLIVKFTGAVSVTGGSEKTVKCKVINN